MRLSLLLQVCNKADLLRMDAELHLNRHIHPQRPHSLEGHLTLSALSADSTLLSMDWWAACEQVHLCTIGSSPGDLLVYLKTFGCPTPRSALNRAAVFYRSHGRKFLSSCSPLCEALVGQGSAFH